MNIGRTLASLVTAGALLAAAACGSDTTSTSASPGIAPAGNSDPTCMTQMTPEQKNQLVAFTNQPGNEAQIDSTTNNADGTQDVCILEPDGAGSYNERYYKQDDHFGDYLLYSALLGRSNNLATIGLISGDLSVGDALALSLLTGVGNDGGLYHPYTQGSNGWNRQSMTINNVHVTNVQYGNQPKTSYAKAKTAAPPKGYAKPTLPPKTADTATVTKDAKGKPVVKSNKSVATAPNITNPSGGKTGTNPAPQNAPKATVPGQQSPPKANTPPKVVAPPKVNAPPKVSAPKVSAPKVKSGK